MALSIYEALADVKRLKRDVLESRQFYGYSGPARIISGILALGNAALLQSGLVPPSTAAHLLAWTIVCFVGAGVNYGALLLWFKRSAPGSIDRSRLKPVLDPIPALCAGGILSAACILHGNFDLLFGVWMITFGVAHLAARDALDEEISYLGWFYIVAGAVTLLIFRSPFLDPWPMGIVFFAGEALGGSIFLRMRGRDCDE